MNKNEIKDKLILLIRHNPLEFEIHRGTISQTNNLILKTKDRAFAKKLVDSYNKN